MGYAYELIDRATIKSWNNLILFGYHSKDKYKAYAQQYNALCKLRLDAVQAVFNLTDI